MKTFVVIGNNFGDEGKGLVTDHFAKTGEKTLVIRHNGGAQAGHTVETGTSRFIFHELGSGSFAGADTLWAKTFFPDLYKLGDEYDDFVSVSGIAPHIFCDKDATPTLLDDVLLNMLLETLRADHRHGSCGMGINEAFLRTRIPKFALTVSVIQDMAEHEIFLELQRIRKEYLPMRLRELVNLGEIPRDILNNPTAYPAEVSDYMGLLTDDSVLLEEARTIRNTLSLIKVVNDTEAFVKSYDTVIFEGAQGLLLDTDNQTYAPHLTPSKTGCHNPVMLMKEWNMPYESAEYVYVTRSYVTRHGAGPLPHEISESEILAKETDATNVENPWQGKIRYGLHERVSSIIERIENDLRSSNVFTDNGSKTCNVRLFVTHLNETEGLFYTQDGNLTLDELTNQTKTLLSGIYQSYNRW